MAKLLLDEFFFERDNTDKYIDDVINFIDNYFEDEVVFFHPYCNPNNLWMIKNEISSIELKIMKKGKVHICDLNSIENIKDEDIIPIKIFSDEFLKKINYIYQEYDDVIIFNAPENQTIKEIRPYKHVYLINHIKREINSNIAYFIINGIFIKNLIEPSIDSPLPNIKLCNEYKNLQNELICGKDSYGRIPIFLQVVSEVLERNTYIPDEYLSSINSTKNKIRKIFKKSDLSLYGSIDIDTGSIEICDHNGHHVDEYGFNNEKHNKHDSTGKHDIKLHK